MDREENQQENDEFKTGRFSLISFRYRHEGLARRWAAERVTSGRASAPQWPAGHFRLVAEDFLRSCGRLRSPSSGPPGRYDEKLADFITAQQETHWHSTATCNSALWQVRRFLDYLQHAILSSQISHPVTSTHIFSMWLNGGVEIHCALARKCCALGSRIARSAHGPGLALPVRFCFRVSTSTKVCRSVPLGTKWAGC